MIVPEGSTLYRRVSNVVDEANEVISKARSGENPPLLYRWRKFNEKMGGLFFDDLVTIAARSGVGKSAILAIIMRDLLEINHHLPLLGTFDSLEMPAYQLVLRWYSADHRIETKRMRSYLNPVTEEDFEAMKATGESLRGLPLLISDRPVTALQWYREGEELIAANPDKKIVRFFDHTRLLTKSYDRQAEEEKITEFMIFANILKNKGVPTILLSQLNRDIEKGDRVRIGSNPPVMADIFGASSVENLSTVVIALHRPELYGCKEYGGLPTKNLLAAHVLKQREGWIGMIALKEELKYYRITDGDEVNINEDGEAVLTFR